MCSVANPIGEGPTYLIDFAFSRFFFRFGARRRLHDLEVAVWLLRTSDEQAIAFDKLESALSLIEEYAPARFQDLQRDLDSILVAGAPNYRATYIHKLRRAEFYEGYLLDPVTTPASLACTLIHEAQHARLFRLGFGYDEPIRGRIERICFRVQRNFALLLPAGEELVAEAEAMLAADLEFMNSHEARTQGRLKALGKLGCPGWLIAIAAWISQRRTAKRIESH